MTPKLRATYIPKPKLLNKPLLKIFLFLIAILPTLALLLFFMYSDKFKEPKKTVLSTFILGIFIIAPLEVFHYGTEMIIGEPIHSSKIENPTENDIIDLRNKYIDSLKCIFDKYKTTFGWNDSKLEIY